MTSVLYPSAYSRRHRAVVASTSIPLGLVVHSVYMGTFARGFPTKFTRSLITLHYFHSNSAYKQTSDSSQFCNCSHCIYTSIHAFPPRYPYYIPVCATSRRESHCLAFPSFLVLLSHSFSLHSSFWHIRSAYFLASSHSRETVFPSPCTMQTLYYLYTY